jgi:5-methylthioadenosine/S-adenosylhomocysteine deaminase
VSRLIVTNALVVPMTGERKPFHGYARVVDGIIGQVSEGSPRQIGNNEDIIDASGCVLMPGLVNAHTHLYQVLLRAVWEDLPLLPWLKRIYGTAQVLRPEHCYAGTILGCIEAIQSGVTTLCEHNFLNPHPDCALETVRAIKDSRLRAVFARTVMDTGDIVPDCVKEKPEQAFRRIEALIGANQENGLLTFMTGPNTPPLNTTPDLLRDIRSFADEKSIGISAHVAESKAVVEFTQEKHGKAGVVEFLDHFGIPGSTSIFAHCVHISEPEIRVLRERGTSVSHNPVSNMMLGDGVAPVVSMLRHGVNIALGTDGAASNHSQDLFETMKTASLLQKVYHQDAGVIDPYTVLRMATLGGARALGLSSVCGSIEVGKRADLILVRLDTIHTQPLNDLFSQLVHCAKASDVQTVIVDGQILMRDRQLKFLEENKTLEVARTANRDLMTRLSALSF